MTRNTVWFTKRCKTVLKKIKEFLNSSQQTCYITFYDEDCGFDRVEVPCTPTQEAYQNDLCGSINYDSGSDGIEFTAIGMTSTGEKICLYWTFAKYDDNGNLLEEWHPHKWEHPDDFDFI